MSSTLVSSKLYSMDGETSLTGARVVVVFHVRVTEATTPQKVILLAQGADDSDDDNRPVPVIDAAFSTSLDGQTTPDSTITVSNIRAGQQEPGPDKRLNWNVNVTYQNPTLSGTAGAGRELDKHPTDRIARFRTEQLVVTEVRDRGANKEQITYPFLETRTPTPGVDPKDGFWGSPRKRYADGFELVTNLGPITDASGRRVQNLPTIQRRLPIFVMKSNTLNPFAWIDIYENYTDDDGRPFVNNASWNVFNQGRNAGTRRCVFWSAECSDPMYWGSLVYYELTVKVLYDKRGHDIRVRNEGTDFWRTLTSAQREEIEKQTGAVKGAVKAVRDVFFSSGLPVPPPIALNLDGTLRSNQVDDVDILTYRDLKGKDFSTLTQAVDNA